MLTYDLQDVPGPIYLALSRCIKEDITCGRLHAGEHLPSKRALARNNGVSTITVQNAYDQLVSEGYVVAQERRGYFVAALGTVPQVRPPQSHLVIPERTEKTIFDFSANHTEVEQFPFSVWAKLTREMLTQHKEEMLQVSPCGGVAVLRQALAGHLASFRGMAVDPAQIIVGAGTEYLYGLLIQLLGRNHVYGIETPGYRKLQQIYEHQGVRCTCADMDEQGVRVAALETAGAEIAHICPNHHFPTGITMPISRRYELLAWANQSPVRYIIEDDYDSEFRLKGRPLPTLQSIDASGRVIYMNTFSKSLTSSIRISNMVLPVTLAKRFYQELAFYACTVPRLEQYTLAAFIRRGHFERHINRMRRHYGRKREQVLAIIRAQLPSCICRVLENDSGLHFLLELRTEVPDQLIQHRLAAQGIRIHSLEDYQLTEQPVSQHRFLLNYSNLDLDKLPQALQALHEAIRKE